ncbi:hypothetical protein MMC21_001397 [Puttea exsequens]|nr:hypothetical protein [Puttea exsequens]
MEQRQYDSAQCYGEGCTIVKVGGFSGRVCLWCGLRLPGERSRAEARRDYDQRHLLARAHSSYERAPEDEDLNDTYEQRALWESTSQANARQETRNKAREYHHLEAERQEILTRVYKKRSLTAAAAEDRRWEYAETLRRSDSMFYPPPAPKINDWMNEPSASDSRTVKAEMDEAGNRFTAEISTWQDSDSIALTLQDIDSCLPSYDDTFEDSSSKARKTIND